MTIAVRSVTRRVAGSVSALNARSHEVATPGPGRARFLAAEDAVGFVVRGVVTMRVDRRRRRLQPDPRWALRPRRSVAEHLRRCQPRLENLASIGLRVAAVDAAAGKIEEHVSAIQLRRPRTE
jgi:hypothetical protein